MKNFVSLFLYRLKKAKYFYLILFILLYGFIFLKNRQSKGKKSISYLSSKKYSGLLSIKGDKSNNSSELKILMDTPGVVVKLKDEIVYHELFYQKNYPSLRVIVLDSQTKELLSFRIFLTIDPEFIAELNSFLTKIYYGSVIILVHTKVTRNNNPNSGDLSNFKSLSNFCFYFNQISNFKQFFVLVFIKDTTSCLYEDSNFLFDKIIYIKNYMIDRPRFVCLKNFKEEYLARKTFCEKSFAFPEFCDCKSPYPITSTSEILDDAKMKIINKIPILIIASNRPYYLIECIKSILRSRGVDKSMIIVDVDEDNPEINAIINLFGLKKNVNLARCSNECSINNHYYFSLKNIIKTFNSDFVFIFEDDLVVSNDIFQYFASLLEIYSQDSTIFCISAWNDQCYKHSVADLTMIYRIRFMPGLGLVLSKNIIKKLLSLWKINRKMNWDAWVRTEHFKNKVCLIPDVSRTFHIGKFGVHSSPLFHSEHFTTRFFREDINVNLSTNNLTIYGYQNMMIYLVKNSKTSDMNKACQLASEKIPSTIITTDLPLEDLVKITKKVIFKGFSNTKERKFNKLFECLKIWPGEARGENDGYFRTWIQNYHYIFILCPYSYLCEYVTEQR